jgi:hypothetical protein
LGADKLHWVRREQVQEIQTVAIATAAEVAPGEGVTEGKDSKREVLADANGRSILVDKITVSRVRDWGAGRLGGCRCVNMIPIPC